MIFLIHNLLPSEIGGSYNPANDSTIGKKRKAEEDVKVKSEDSEVKAETETTEGDTSGKTWNVERQIQYSAVLYFEFYIGPDT